MATRQSVQAWAYRANMQTSTVLLVLFRDSVLFLRTLTVNRQTRQEQDSVPE
jgi:hypothetical protein